MRDLFLFIELAEAVETQVEILRVGEFIDSRNRTVAVTEEDLDAYVANFETGEAGQDVPIDVQHEKAEAAGWLKKLWRNGDRLLGQVDWNSLGQQLVGDQMFKYLSATIDTANKIIRSVSLVNFPAVKGLAPVELAEGVYGLSTGGDLEKELNESEPGGDVSDQESKQEVDMPNEAELQEMRDQIRSEIEAEMAQKEQTVAELRQQLRTEVMAELEQRFERRQGLVEFAEALCNGEASALSAKADEVVSFLEGLDDDQVDQAKVLLSSKVVDFSERGSSREGRPTTAELSAEYGASLQAWIESGQSIEEFFNLNRVELGSPDDYDLSQWMEEE
jgi:hypothetical protein